MSKLLKAVNEQAKDISNIDLLNKLSSVLDKHREVSIQEAAYRILSLKMTYSSVAVKFLSTIHPHFRDGLVRANLEDLNEDESVFHTSLHQYYENRAMKCKSDVNYEDFELKEGYWETLSLAEFWSLYDIVYGENKRDKSGKLQYIPLENKKGCVKRRTNRCILKYYLNYNNDEDLARGLLILFHPFQDENKEIHEQNVIELYEKNKKRVDERRNLFEKHKIITDIVNTLSKEREESNVDDTSEEEVLESETTSIDEIESFEKWAKSQAKIHLKKHDDLTKLVKVSSLRESILTLNEQQRLVFDDFCERHIGEDEVPFYLYIGGEAGTGKSYLLRLMIETLKHLNMKSGDELNKPSSIVMAPTANASYIIKGKTIESALGMLPRKRNSFVKVNKNKISNLTFLYEDVSTVFCDEISMVGSCKFTKIHFQLQDIRGDNRFMGGLNFVAVGDFRQLPPVLDTYVYNNNHLDGRPALAPSHWDENFQIFYLTEKMRSQKDANFSQICDRVGNGTYDENDLKYLRNCVRNTDSENHNENFKTGKVSLIVTTNKKRQEINEDKLERLLKDAKSYLILAVDRSTNLENPPEVPSNMTVTQTGGLEQKLLIKKNAPIVLTSNHHIAKYKEDGIVNGARAYIDSIQVSKKDKDVVEVIWVVFKDQTVGRLLRYEYNHLKKMHKPIHDDAVPILKQKKNFTINKGEVRFQREQFPLTLAYAITAYKCQGETLDEVIIDFSHERGERANIQWGSFYVALTRVKEGKNVYLKSFDESHITFNVQVENKICAMRQLRPYIFKKIYLSEQIFRKTEEEIKLGYFNIRGFLESNHARYLDHDWNLLNLDFLVVAETWLIPSVPNNVVKEKLKNWKIIKRLDATDNKKHMGLLLLVPSNSEEYDDIIYHLDYVEGYNKRNRSLLYQGIVIDLKKVYRRFVCLYIRETPGKEESIEIGQRFADFDGIVGDLNLNPAIQDQKSKLNFICGSQKSLALQEITHINNNQLEHVLLNECFIECCFATSFFNFGSDHKSVVVRIGQSKSDFTKEFLEKRNFDRDHHLKSKNKPSNSTKEPQTIIGEERPILNQEGIRSKKNKERKVEKTMKQKNQNPKPDTNFILLRFSNPPRKNLCFSNVVASCLLNIPEIKNILLDHRKSHQNVKPITEELEKLSKSRNFSDASTQPLRSIVQLKCFESGQLTKEFDNNLQHDSGEFMQSLFEHFWNEQIDVNDTLMENLFGGISQDILSCCCGNRVELAPQHLSQIIPIQIVGESVQNGFENIFKTEKISWKCPKCSSPTVNKRVWIVQEPATLILQLMRYSFDVAKNEASKIEDPVACPKNLLLSSGTSYSLHSVINHHGEETKSGHYNMILYDKNADNFVLLDDSNVSFLDDSHDMNTVSYISIYVKD